MGAVVDAWKSWKQPYLLFAQELSTFGNIFALFTIESLALVHFGSNLIGAAEFGKSFLNISQVVFTIGNDTAFLENAFGHTLNISKNKPKW